MAKALSQEERQLIKMIGKLPVQEAEKTTWTEQILHGGMNEDLVEAIRTRLNEPVEDAAAEVNPLVASNAAANRSRYLVELASLVRRWRLTSQAHNFGGRR